MSAPTFWMARVESYLVTRRGLGYELKSEETQLQSFARFADAHAAGHLTLALAVAWARAARRADPFTWARRMEVLRGFARYCLVIDSATVIPPPQLFGRAHRRRVPHIYTDAELSALLAACADLAPYHGLRPATCATVFGLLAATGLRIGEALALTSADVNLVTGVLHIRKAKGHKERLVPLHPGVTAHLASYAEHRDALVPRSASDRFFLRDDGQPANRGALLYALRTITRRFGWPVRGDHADHRLHDLRHTFVVRSLLRAYRQGSDIDHVALRLSAYVGHAKISDTYWYLTGIPELMAIAATRFHDYAHGAL